MLDPPIEPLWQQKNMSDSQHIQVITHIHFVLMLHMWIVMRTRSTQRESPARFLADYHAAGVNHHDGRDKD